MYDKISIIGYSGHAYVVIDAAIESGLALQYYCNKSPVEYNPFGLEYLGFEKDLDFFNRTKEVSFVLGVGDNKIRSRIARTLLTNDKNLVNVIHPSSSLSSYFTFGTGNFIGRQVLVNALSTIGSYCVLNTGCIVEHECKLGDGVHIAPGAVLAGNVQVGDETFIGANAVVRQGIKIGANSIIGAGAVVVRDIGDNQIVVGNPAKKHER